MTEPIDPYQVPAADVRPGSRRRSNAWAPEATTLAPKSPADILFSAGGRISRSVYWLYSLPLFFGAWLIIPMMGAIGAESIVGRLMTVVLYAAVYLMSILVTIKRWHDRDKSGWFVLVAFIPIVGWVWSLVELGFLPGTDGPNRYGEDPLSIHGDPA